MRTAWPRRSIALLAWVWICSSLAPTGIRAGVDPLTRVSARTISGGFAAAATCIGDNAQGGPRGGSLTLSGIPAGSRILQATLYYVVIHPTSPVPAGSPTLDGVLLDPVRLAEEHDSPCFDQDYTAAFRADVTSLVGGDGTYLLDDFPASGGTFGTFTEGATLVVVYCQDTLPAVEIVIYEGIDILSRGDPNHSQTLTGFAASAGPLTASWLAVIGNGQDTTQTTGNDDDPLSFNGTLMEQVVPTEDVLAGGACVKREEGWWDLGLYDVSSLVTAASTSAAIGLNLRNDCYSVVAYVLTISSDSVAEPCVSMDVSFSALWARRHEEGVEIGWTTASELDTFGFRVRSRDRHGQVSELPGLVFSRGSGSTYSVVDRIDPREIEEGLDYQVVEIRFDGREGDRTPWQGLEPVQADPQHGNRMRNRSGRGR